MATPTPRAIVSKVRSFVRRHDILRPGPLLLAVSGGTDSTALALLMAELADDLGLVLHVAHFDHRTRPDDAAADAQFVADLAARIGAPIRVGRAAKATESEDAARRERYAFLRRAAHEVGAVAIATGHTVDDQAETVLLHLVRGSGIRGASGMRPLRDGIARPLLSIGRVDTSAICRAAGIVPREDPTNASLRFARNRIRLTVLPELESLNPKVREALARFADAAADVDAALATEVDARRGDIAPAMPSGAAAATSLRTADATSHDTAIDVGALPASRAPRQRILADAYRRATGVTLTQRQRLALVDLTGSTDGTREIDLPGARVVREYGRLRFEPAGTQREAVGAGRAADAEVRLLPGAEMEWHAWRISLGMEKDGLPFAGSVDAASAPRLAVRSRRPGDRVSERRKLQDVFVNAKVPVRLRDRWPVVTLAGSVLWVPGLTEPPRRGRIALAAGPVGDDLTDSGVVFRRSAHSGRVASSSEGRPRGGKRGRR